MSIFQAQLQYFFKADTSLFGTEDDTANSGEKSKKALEILQGGQPELDGEEAMPPLLYKNNYMTLGAGLSARQAYYQKTMAIPFNMSTQEMFYAQTSGWTRRLMRLGMDTANNVR